MKPTLLILTWFFYLFTFTVFSLSAEEEANEFYEKALISYEKSDYNSAVIHLKNTFKTNKDHLPGKILFAKMLLKFENGINAEIELNTAKKLGADLDIIAPLLAEALMYQQKFEQTLATTIPGSRKTKVEAELAYFRGQAFLGLKKYVFAEESFNHALSLINNYSEANVGKAQIFIVRKQFKLAQEYADKALASYNVPENVRVLRARLYLRENKIKPALSILNKALEIEPNYLEARLLKAEILITEGEIEQAEKDIDYILNRAPKEPESNYLKAIILSKGEENEQIEQTFENILATLRAIPSEVRSEKPQYLFLAGYVLYNQGNLAESGSFLRQYLEHVDDLRAIIMLAEIELTLNNFGHAKTILTKANRKHIKNEKLLTLLGTVHLKLKQQQNAQRYFIEALKINSNNPKVLIQLAQSFIAERNYSKALEILAPITEAFPDHISALLLKNNSFIGKSDYKSALMITQHLSKVRPQNAYFHFLHGKNFLAAYAYQDSKQAFMRALALDGNALNINLALVSVDIAEKKLTNAKQSLDNLLFENPENIEVMHAIANYYSLINKDAESIYWLEKILAIDVTNLSALIALEKVSRKTGKLEKITKYLKDTLQKKSIAEVHQLLGGIYLTQRDYTKAITHFELYVELASNRGEALSTLAQAQLTAHNVPAAISALRKSLAWNSDLISNNILLTKLLIASNEIEQAELQIIDIRKKDGRLSIADLLQGDIYYKQAKYQQALELYFIALKSNKSTNTVLSIYRSYKKLNQLSKAEDFLKKTIETHEKTNVKFIIALADIYQLQDKYSLSIQLYKDALIDHPESPFILNNLAISLIERQQADLALTYATKAFELSPNNITILDTLAWNKMQLNEHENALTLLRKAATINADDNMVKYHLSITLDKLGRRKAAKNILIDVVESNQPFKKSVEAKQLLDSWL